MDFSDDLEALAELGDERDLERLESMARSGMEPGKFAEFMSMEPDQRVLVLRLLAGGDDAAHEELRERLDGPSLARWLFTLPAFRGGYADDEEDDD